MPQRSLGFETRKLAHAIKLFVDASVSKEINENLSGVEGMVLGYLFHHADDAVTAQTLMDHFKVKKAACSQTLHSLENKGLIKMEPLARDKRVKRIVPTEKGEDVHAEFDRIFTKINAQIEQGLSDAEKEQYRATMTKIATNIGADYFFEEDK